MQHYLFSSWVYKRSIFKRSIFFGTLVLMLTSCGPLISFGSPDAQRTFSLSPVALNVVPENDQVIYVEEPYLSGGRDGRKLTVALSKNETTTLAGVQWSDNLSDMIRDNLVRSLERGTGAKTLGETGLDIKASCRLGLTVHAFDYVVGGTPGEDMAMIDADLLLVNLQNNTLLYSQTISTTAPIVGSNPMNAAIALDQAFADFQRQVINAFMQGSDNQGAENLKLNMCTVN